MPTFLGGIIYSASPQHLSWRGHVPPVPPVSYAPGVHLSGNNKDCIKNARIYMFT